MSKHQSCRECRRDFIGPDGNIPDNLCPECDEVIHADCHEEILQLEVASKGMAVELCDYAKTVTRLNTKVEQLEAEKEGMQDKIQQILRWADAYPLTVFPKPDLQKAAEVLKAAGMTLDAISADNMRHVLEGVKRILKEAKE